MKTAFERMFWGFILILIDIHFGIDLLPDPVGYFLIGYGISLLLTEFPIGKKAYIMVMVLSVLSIPSVFIDQPIANDLTQPWGVYYFILGILKWVLAFYLFQLMQSIARKKHEKELRHYTSTVMKFYLFSLLAIYITMPFSMNFYEGMLGSYTVTATIIELVMEIVFLFLLLRFRKLDGAKDGLELPDENRTDI